MKYKCITIKPKKKKIKLEITPLTKEKLEEMFNIKVEYEEKEEIKN